MTDEDDVEILVVVEREEVGSFVDVLSRGKNFGNFMPWESVSEKRVRE